MNRIARYLIPFGVFLTTFALGIFLLSQHQELRVNKESQLVQQVLNTQESELTRRLSYSLSSTYLLAQEVARTKGRVENFDSYAASLLARMDGISNLQLAPDGVVSKIFPLKGNEAAIGHNIFRDDKRKDEAVEAVRRRVLTLAGPFELVQGGVAVIGRNPVFIPQEDGSDVFWGFTSALILLDDLIGGAGLHSLNSSAYVYELSRIIPDTELRSVFASNGDSEGVEMQSIEIAVPNGQWELRVGLPFEQQSLFFHRLAEILSFTVAVIFGVFTRRIAVEPEKLRKQVAQQTQVLKKLAFFDDLTGLPNRHNFNESLDRRINARSGDGKVTALLLLDLDNFKEVNDTLGHDMGDVLLIQAGQRLSSVIPEGAKLARLGGDEFVIIVSAEDVRTVTETISQDIIQTIGRPFDLQGNSAHVSASIGIAHVSETYNCSASELFKCADQAMYEVKRAGKGGYKYHSEDIKKKIAVRAGLTNDLREAIEEGSLDLYYQPIICADSGRIEKAEALLRWNHPSQGAISPVTFIPLAEESGLIHELGEWVFKEALRQVSHWRNTFNPKFQISINVSPVQFQSEGNVANWVDAIRNSGQDADCILLEITEGLLLENNSRNAETLALFKSAGIPIALDDFGTGYSSLSYLKRLDIDIIKIDRSFVNNLAAGNEDLVLCQAIVSIADSLNFKVVAEGVETQEQVSLLSGIGCDYLQGFLYSKPIDRVAFERLILDFPGEDRVISSAA